MRVSLFGPGIVIALLALGCGGGGEPDSSATTGGEAPSATCEGYAPDDACMNDDNFAQCQQMAAQCPGEVQVMESCPLQFGCP